MALPKATTAALMAACVLYCGASATWTEFFTRRWWDPTYRHNPTFRGAQFWDVSTNVAVDGASAQGDLACFGDFDSDRFTDIVTVDPDTRRNVSIRLWRDAQWTFGAPSATVTEAAEVLSVAATDMDRDGLLDLVVCVKGDPATSPVTLVIHYGDGWGGLRNGTTKIEGLAEQPLVADWNGDLVADVLASVVGGKTVVFVNEGGSYVRREVAGLPTLSSPHSSAFLDINGDCHADFAFTTAEGKVELWLWNASAATYVKESRLGDLQLPPGAGQVTWGDFDRDGAVDMAFAVCSPAGACNETSSIVLLRNKQVGVCGSTLAKGSATCRGMNNLCTADPHFSFSSPSAATSSPTNGVTVVDKTVFDSLGVRLSSPGVNGVPLTIRSGDFNLDGNADFLVPVQDLKTGERFVQMWESVPCTQAICPLATGSEMESLRTLRPRTDGTAQLTGITGAYGGTFFDFGESGNPGVFVLTHPSLALNASEQKKPRIRALYNNFRPDALFVKGLGLNGVCTARCPGFPDPKPYGVSYPGGTFKIAVTDTGGTLISAQTVQTFHTSYLPLLTPYTIVGLGRISNYIEVVSYGVASSQPKYFSSWQGVIPNSQMVAIPYKAWTLELFLSPSGIIFWVILTIGLSLIVLGGLIGYLKLRERREDMQHRESDRHLFDFNAL